MCAANHTMSRLEDNNTNNNNNNNDSPPKMNTTMGGKLPPPNSSQANNSTFVHCHNLLDKILINCSNDPVGNVHRTWSITLLMIAIYVIITIFQSTYLFLRVFSLRLCVHIYIYNLRPLLTPPEYMTSHTLQISRDQQFHIHSHAFAFVES